MVIEMAPLQRLPLLGRERTEEGMRELRETARPSDAEALDQAAESGLFSLEVARVHDPELRRGRQARLPRLRREQFLLRDPAKQDANETAFEPQLAECDA